ncbi:MAG: EAL domain-containing protein [Fimbriimonas sp.]|nr:EAL domain-containing protein [Fimbriimonas sp.]
MTKQDLEVAISEKQIRLVYQPKIECATGALTGFEALARWDHPELGLVMPDLFIPLAEQSGLIDAITDQVAGQALRWYGDTPAVQGLTLSINLSEKSLGNMELADRLKAKCAEAGISEGCVILEIAEQSAMDDQLLTLDMFAGLRMLGFRVSIDHFGLRETSTPLLARLPFSEIKIDKSIALADSRSFESQEYIKSKVDLGHRLGLSVVTEGVEDRETLEFLKKIGCDIAQGYYIACPMSGDLVTDWMYGRDEARMRRLL